MDFVEFTKRYKKRLYGVYIDNGATPPKIDESRLAEIYMAVLVIREWDNEQMKKEIARGINR